MKTLVVIKNELFQDYLRFISTSDLPSALDSPDTPLPFTCLESVENKNADALIAELKSYFNGSKVGSKDFYKLDEATVKQLQFMFNLIKLSSGQEGSVTQTVTQVAPAVAPETVDAIKTVGTVDVVEVVAVKAEPVAEKKSEPAPAQVEQSKSEPVVQKTNDVPAKQDIEIFEDVFLTSGDDEDSPFSLKAEAVSVSPSETKSETNDVVNPVLEENSNDQMIESLGIAKGSTVHFIKDASITAILVDEKLVSYEGEEMSLVDAAKASFKKSGTVGMAVGLANWTYEGDTLKAWKEKQMN